MSNKLDYKIMMQSENIYYIELSIDLIDDYLKMVNDESIQKCISTKRRIFTYEDEMNWIKKKMEEKAIIFSMIDKDTGDFVGNFEFMNVKSNSAEIGISITRKYQNKHYGTEALKTMIEYGFNSLGLDEITLSVFSNNERAIHCYKNLGFVEYKVDENAYLIDNENVSDIYMVLRK